MNILTNFDCKRLQNYEVLHWTKRKQGKHLRFDYPIRSYAQFDKFLKFFEISFDSGLYSMLYICLMFKHSTHKNYVTKIYLQSSFQ